MATPRRLRMNALLETRDGTPSNKDARLTNCLLELKGEQLEVIKRPGWTSNTTPATGAGLGAISVPTPDGGTQIVSIVDDTAYVTVNVASSSWATNGNVNINSQTDVPGAVLYFKNKFWVLNPVQLNTGLPLSKVYSSTTGASWTLVKTNPEYDTGFTGPRTGFGACVFAGKMWVMGGFDSTLTTRKNSVYYSADGVTWTLATASATWTARYAFPVLVYNNKMWLIGGYPGAVARDVYYSSDGATWTQATAAAAFSARQGYACEVFAGKMWVMGGFDTGYLADCWYSTDGATWANAGNAGWSARRNAGVAVLNNYCYIMGGKTGASAAEIDLWGSSNGTTWTELSTDLGFAGGTTAIIPYFVTSSGITSLKASAASLYVFGYYTDSGQAQANWNTTEYLGTPAATSSSLGVLASGLSATPQAGFSPSAYYDAAQTLDKTKVMLKNSAGAWYYTVAGQTLTAVTDADYPASTVRGLAYLDGTFYVMDPNGKICGSELNDPSSWSALNVLNAQAEPDNGVAIIKYGQYVVAFGNYTIEFFYDAGNVSGSPLGPVQNAQMLVGCAKADSITQVEGTVFFIGQRKSLGQSVNVSRFVGMLTGTSYSVVSTPDIDRILNADNMSNANGCLITMLGHPLYLLNLPTTNISLAYDLKGGMWYYFTTGTVGSAVTLTSLTSAAQTDGSYLCTATKTGGHGFSDGDPITIAGATPAGYNGTFNVTVTSATVFTYVVSSTLTTPATGTITATGYTQGYLPITNAFDSGSTQVFQHKTTGALLSMSDTTYTDNSIYIDTKMRSARFDQGLSKEGNSQTKFLPWMDVVTDKAASTTKVLVRWSDDDYQTHSKYRYVDIYYKRSRLNRCGAFIRRSFEIRHTASSALRFQGYDLGLEQGAE